MGFFFGILKRGRYDNQEAEVIGWYRRAPVPNIELKSIQVRGEREKCHTYIAKYIWAGILTLIGIGLMI